MSTFPRAHRNAMAMPGFSLVELMVSLVVASLGFAGVLQFFVNYQRVTQQQEQMTTLQINLRAASDRMTSHLRRSGYGVPPSLLEGWIDWVPGFDANPKITPGATASDPDRISIATCTSKPVATVAATLPAGVANTTVTLTSLVPGQTIEQLFDSAKNRNLIRFVAGAQAGGGFARAVSVSGSTVTIDADPGAAGEQGFSSRDYFPGTPICRVDVTTYGVDTVTRTLTIDEHQGGGVQRAFDGITDLQISGGGGSYAMEITGRSERPDPTTGNPIPRRLRPVVTVRNP